jgi:hypothetical protein
MDQNASPPSASDPAMSSDDINQKFTKSLQTPHDGSASLFSQLTGNPFLTAVGISLS